MLYVIYNKSSGQLVTTIEATSPPAVMDHHAFITATTVPDFYTSKVVKGKLVEIVTQEYIDARKSRLKNDITAARDAKLAAGYASPYGNLQADISSRTNIQAAAMRAQANLLNYSVDWRMADNTTVKLDGPKMVAVGTGLGAFVSSVYERSFVLKTQLAALTTLAQLNAFVITF